MLSDKIAHFKAIGESLATTPAQYKSDFPFLKEVDSLALANVQLHLQAAYKNFFRDKSVGFPKFKSKKHNRNRYTTNNQNGTVAIADGFVRLPKIGMVKAVIHRHAPADWRLKSATVSMENDGSFYVSVLYEYDSFVAPVAVADINESKVIGLDYKSDGLFMDSNGNVADMPKFYCKSQKKLAKEQRKLRNKTKFSKNWEKQQRNVAKVHRKVANQRKDFLHKLSTEITNQYEVICIESLNMKAMSNYGFGNGKATLDNANGMFTAMLAYKQADKGHYLMEVDKYYPSSQLLHCHPQCRMKLSLSERKITCPVCGNTYDRDHNAAINIKNEGLRMLRENETM